jgi:DeoR/GlpR family transcriptional regulator of sugar metabolism
LIYYAMKPDTKVLDDPVVKGRNTKVAKIKRDEEILSLLSKKPFLTIEQLYQELGVSPATVRRDLSRLEQSGSILRINGGAMMNREEVSSGREPHQAGDPFLDEKRRIAEAAAALVQEGHTIFIDAGSTNLQIADLLVKFSNITVITNSIEIAHKFIGKKKVSIIVCGGTLGEANPSSVVGPIAEKVIAMFRANLCFIGSSGVDLKYGITDPYISSARIKEAMIENSMKVVLVVDRSKFNVTNSVFVCPIEKIDHLITDSLAPRDDIDLLVDKGIGVTLV